MRIYRRGHILVVVQHFIHRTKNAHNLLSGRTASQGCDYTDRHPLSKYGGVRVAYKNLSSDNT